MKVKKQFNDGKFYDGTIVKYDKRKKWFLVKYEDDDEEEMNLNELKKVLKDKPKTKPTTEIRKRVV